MEDPLLTEVIFYYLLRTDFVMEFAWTVLTIPVFFFKTNKAKVFDLFSETILLLTMKFSRLSC